MKLVTRAQLGWPTSAAPLQATAKGVKVHYEGAPVSTKLLTDHDACIAEWKAIRASHLANKVENYSDVAYNFAACPHGYLLEGRGIGRRTGANGNQTLNIAHYAIVGLVGSEGLTEPTDAMLGAIRDGIELLRKNGAGNEIKGHRDGYATACPGPELYAWVQQGAPRPTEEDDVALTDADVQKIAVAVATKTLTLDGVIDNPNPATAPDNPFISLETSIRNIETVTRRTEAVLTAQIGALSAAVAALARDGGLPLAQVQAAAEAGAQAALDRLGDALTKEN